MEKLLKTKWSVANYRIYANQFSPPEYPIHAEKRGRIAKTTRKEDAVIMSFAPELLDLLLESKHGISLEWADRRDLLIEQIGLSFVSE